MNFDFEEWSNPWDDESRWEFENSAPERIEERLGHVNMSDIIKEAFGGESCLRNKAIDAEDLPF